MVYHVVKSPTVFYLFSLKDGGDVIIYLWYKEIEDSPWFMIGDSLSTTVLWYGRGRIL